MMYKLSDYERGYLEAAIDTDGSISMLKHKHRTMNI